MRKLIEKFGRKYFRGFNETELSEDLKDKKLHRFTLDSQRVFVVYKKGDFLEVYEELAGPNKHIAKVDSSSKIARLVKLGVLSLF